MGDPAVAGSAGDLSPSCYPHCACTSLIAIGNLTRLVQRFEVQFRNQQKSLENEWVKPLCRKESVPFRDNFHELGGYAPKRYSALDRNHDLLQLRLRMGASTKRSRRGGVLDSVPTETTGVPEVPAVPAHLAWATVVRTPDSWRAA